MLWLYSSLYSVGKDKVISLSNLLMVYIAISLQAFLNWNISFCTVIMVLVGRVYFPSILNTEV